MTDLVRALSRPGSDRRRFRIGVCTTAPAAGVIGVNVDGSVGVYPVLSGTTIAVGDTVLVARDSTSSAIVLGRIGTPAVAPNLGLGNEPPPVGQTLRTVALVPTFTGTWNGGYGWEEQTDVYQGIAFGGDGPVQRVGVVHYGNQIEALAANLGQPHSASVTYRRVDDYAAPLLRSAFIKLLYSADEDSYNADLDGTTRVTPEAASGQTVTWQLPQADVTALLSGSHEGLALPYSGTYTGWAGRDTDPDAWRLVITYYG